MSIVWDRICESHTQKLVLLALADNASDQGKCWPSIATIARKCQLTERCVYLQIDRLVERKEIERKSGGGHSSNHYVLRVTPEYGSGVNSVQGCTPFRGPLNTVQGSPEYHSGEPSYNRHRTIKGGKGSPPKVFPSEYRSLIEDAEKEIEAIKGRGILKDSDRDEIKALRLKIAGWKKQRFETV